MSDPPLRILYVAAGIPAPGAVGGSTHVVEVTTGLARLGHQIVTIAGRSAGRPPANWPAGARLVNLPLPKALALATLPAVWAAGRRLRPEVVMERYYNLAGAGLLYAAAHRRPAVLEVNAPLWDPPGSPKDRLDRRLPGHPLRRWATWQARRSDRIVAPLPEAVTSLTPHPHIVRLPWGANTDLFDPDRVDAGERATLRAALGIPATATVAVFSGSFRRWHGVETLLAAAAPLLAARADLHLLLLGHGERWATASQQAQRPPFAGRVTLTGALPYEAMPRHLALADLAVAPFAPEAHAPLRAVGFYWSPLKIFEAMAMRLPVIAPAIPELAATIRDGRDGTLYPTSDAAALTAALAWHLDHRAESRIMGAQARQRVVERFSWAAHCRELERLLLDLRAVGHAATEGRR
jgi:glycosyltransferase involved in cell wall biosynthesis